jgi:hypothetical protein
MHEIAQTLDAMDSTRLLLALLFIAGYASSIGHLASESGRRWSIALAGLAGLGFVGLTNPWVHGALLVVFVVVGVGLFVALAWGFSAWAVHAQAQAPAMLAMTAPVAEPVASAVPMVRRVRRLRRRLAL